MEPVDPDTVSLTAGVDGRANENTGATCRHRLRAGHLPFEMDMGVFA